MKSVLIVDDSEDLHYLAKRIIAKLNLFDDVKSVYDGQEALDYLTDYEEKKKIFGDAFPPLVILLDINMPGMDGFEFLQEYQKRYSDDPRFQSTVCVMITSSSNQQDINLARSYEFVKEFLTKPITKDQLKTVVDKVTHS